MSILYLDEHCACYNYNSGENSLIKTHIIRKNKSWEIAPLDNTLIFMLEGELTISYGKDVEKKLPKGKIMLLVTNSHLKAVAMKDSRLMIMKIPPHIQLCDRYALEQLLQEEGDKSPGLSFLEINKIMNSYLKTIELLLSEGLKCIFFFEMKIKELFFILRGYYTKEELYAFFHPLLSNDMTFSDFVQRNYHKVKTVKELAVLANYSLSGFVKRFKRVFGMSAYQWMKEQKAKIIYHEINDMTKALKEISFEYGFSSPAHFNDFCKIHFGSTPGNIRKSKMNTNK